MFDGNVIVEGYNLAFQRLRKKREQRNSQ